MIRPERLTPGARQRLVSRRTSLETPAVEAARKIQEDFRKDPDGTLLSLAKRFDRADLKSLEVTPEEMAAAEKSVPQNVQAAIRSMNDRPVRNGGWCCATNVGRSELASVRSSHSRRRPHSSPPGARGISVSSTTRRTSKSSTTYCT